MKEVNFAENKMAEVRDIQTKKNYAAFTVELCPNVVVFSLSYT